MKRKSLFSVFCTLILVFLSACGEDKDIRTAIPSDAQMVVSVDWIAMAEKGGLSDLAMSTSLSELIGKQIPGDDKVYVEKILKEPGETGIDFTQKLYAFVNSKADMGVLVKIDSKKRFKRLLRHLGGEWKNKEWQKEGGVEYLQADYEAVLLDNDMAIYIKTNSELTDKGIRGRGIGWLKQKAEDSFTATNACVTFEKENSDLTLWCTLDALMRNKQSRCYVQNSLPRDVRLSDLQCLMGVHFENGCVTLDARMLPEGEAATKFYEEQSEVLGTMQGTFLPDVSLNPWLWAGTSLHGKQCCRLLEQNAGLWQMLDGAAFGFNLRKWLASINGDVALVVCQTPSDSIPSPTDISFKSLPVFAVQAELENDSILDDMDTMMQMLNLLGINMKKDAPGKYGIRLADVPMWLGVDSEKHFFYTTAVDMLKPSKEVPFWALEARRSRFYLRLDIRQMRLTHSLQMFLPMLDLLDVLVVKANDAKSINLQLWAVDRHENILKQLLTALAKTYETN